MSLGDIAGWTALLVAWSAVVGSLAAHHPAVRRRLGVRLGRLVPQWTFFAPVPPEEDVLLLWRGRLADGTLTSWAPAPAFPPRNAWEPVWNPGARLRRAVIDATVYLKLALADGSTPLQLTAPYTALLGCVAQGAAPGVEMVQFAVVTVDDDVPHLLVASDLHAVGPRSP